MSNGNGNGALKRPLTLGNAMALTGFLGTLAAIVTFAVPPLVRSAMNDFADERGYVTRAELRLIVLDRLGTLATKDQLTDIQRRIDRMDSRLQAIERK